MSTTKYKVQYAQLSSCRLSIISLCIVYLVHYTQLKLGNPQILFTLIWSRSSQVRLVFTSCSHPRVLARVLFLLAAIWEGGTDYMRIIEALRSRNQFWRHLTGCLSFTNAAASDTPTLLSKIMVTVDPETSITSSISKDKLVEFSFRYSCEASVFSIMARDIFLQQHLVQTGVLGVKNGALAGSVEDNKDDVGGGTAQTSSGTTKSKQAIEASGAQQVVTEWCRAFQMSAIMRSYAHSLYDKSVLLRAKVITEII